MKLQKSISSILNRILTMLFTKQAIDWSISVESCSQPSKNHQVLTFVLPNIPPEIKMETGGLYENGELIYDTSALPPKQKERLNKWFANDTDMQKDADETDGLKDSLRRSYRSSVRSSVRGRSGGNSAPITIKFEMDLSDVLSDDEDTDINAGESTLTIQEFLESVSLDSPVTTHSLSSRNTFTSTGTGDTGISHPKPHTSKSMQQECIPDQIQRAFSNALCEKKLEKMPSHISNYVLAVNQHVMACVQTEDQIATLRPLLRGKLITLIAKQQIMQSIKKQYKAENKTLLHSSDNRLPVRKKALIWCCLGLAQVYDVKNKGITILFHTAATSLIRHAHLPVVEKLIGRQPKSDTPNASALPYEDYLDQFLQRWYGIKLYGYTNVSYDISGREKKLAKLEEQYIDEPSQELKTRISELKKEIVRTKQEHDEQLRLKDEHNLIGSEEFYLQVLEAMATCYMDMLITQVNHSFAKGNLQKLINGVLPGLTEQQFDTVSIEKGRLAAMGLCLAIINSNLSVETKRESFIVICNKFDLEGKNKLVKYLTENISFIWPSCVPAKFAALLQNECGFPLEKQNITSMLLEEIAGRCISPISSEALIEYASQHDHYFALLLASLPFNNLTTEEIKNLYHASKGALKSITSKHPDEFKSKGQEFQFDELWENKSKLMSTQNNHHIGAEIQKKLTENSLERFNGKEVISYKDNNPKHDAAILCQFCMLCEKQLLGKDTNFTNHRKINMSIAALLNENPAQLEDLVMLAQYQSVMRCWFDGARLSEGL